MSNHKLQTLTYSAPVLRRLEGIITEKSRSLTEDQDNEPSISGKLMLGAKAAAFLECSLIVLEEMKKLAEDAT